MANWLQKASRASLSKLKTVNLPAVRQGQSLRPLQPLSGQPARVPPASIIYGVAASALFVMGIYFLFTGRWVTGLLVALPAAALLGFAMHFLKR
jgi:hypothetical protein